MELLKIAKRNKAQFKKYAVDEMAKERNITVLRFPPCYCELNPIELIWAQMKGFVARENTTFKLQDGRQLLLAGIKRIKEDNWKKAMRHVIEEENRMWKLDDRRNCANRTLNYQFKRC